MSRQTGTIYLLIADNPEKSVEGFPDGSLLLKYGCTSGDIKRRICCAKRNKGCEFRELSSFPVDRENKFSIENDIKWRIAEKFCQGSEFIIVARGDLKAVTDIVKEAACRAG